MNGRGRRLLKREEHLGIGPWSPDGASLLLLTHPQVGLEALTLLDVDTRAARVVASRKRGFLLPVWSPDGRHVAFSSVADAQTRVQEVFALTVADGVMRRLTRSRAATSPTWPDARVLAWSPRSDLILYHSRANVSVVRPDGTGRRHLCKTSPEGPVADAAWPTR